ncbi:MAG: zinc ribbon domain-containing protein [Trueperaceae bacterium]|nr:zinc ribbon domain-containing protein [Trueperaceae bacterium]
MKKTLTYLLCPKCQRSLPSSAKEHYCPNDGSKMLSACPQCNTPITSPYSRFCTNCGGSLLVDTVFQAVIPNRNRDGPIKVKVRNQGL